MIQRSKRSLSQAKASDMKSRTLAFQHEVRRWCSEIPIGSPIYVAISNLNDALNLTDAQLNAAIDNSKRNGTGTGGIHDWD